MKAIFVSTHEIPPEMHAAYYIAFRLLDTCRAAAHTCFCFRYSRLVCVLLLRLLDQISYVLMTLLTFCMICIIFSLPVQLFFSYASFISYFVFSLSFVFSRYNFCVSISLVWFLCRHFPSHFYFFLLLFVNHLLLSYIPFFLFFQSASLFFFPSKWPYPLHPGERGIRFLRNTGVYLTNCIAFSPARQ